MSGDDPKAPGTVSQDALEEELGAVVPHQGWQDQFKRTDRGAVKADIFNVLLVLTFDPAWQEVLGYCDFSYRIVKRKLPPFQNGELGEWDDADTDRFRIWMSQHYDFTPKTSDADGAILVAAQARRFHPVQEYLTGLTWDGEPRLREWLVKYLGVKTPTCEEARYVEAVGRMWMIAAVARVMRPPVKADCVLILEGLQGLGKSTALEILGGEWFSDTHFALGEKDGYQQMQGVWICELAELDSFNKAESTRAKQFFGSKEDRYRPSYGRRAYTFARQCVFAGSTNQDSYLKDATGNRRYWPVFCHSLDVEGLQADRDQLWAEAFKQFELDEPWWPQEDQKEIFADQQDKRFAEDSWEDIIQDWVAAPGRVTKPCLTAAEILSGALQVDAAHMDRQKETRVGYVMKRLGWRKDRQMVDGQRKHVYVKPPDEARGGSG